MSPVALNGMARGASMRKTARWMLAGCCLIVAAGDGMLQAQTVGSAQISGAVRDPSGAAVPNAKVTATQTDTGLVRSTVSGGEGNYVLTNLPVGPYRLEA